MTLGKVLENIDYSMYFSEKEDHLSSENAASVEIGFVCNDSRRIQKNSVFVAIEGYKLDGNNYVPAAIDAGAVVIVSKKKHQLPKGVIGLQVEDARKTLAQISCNFYSHPSKSMQMIGVTASSGKTSTAFMIDQIYRSAGIKTGLMGTVEYRTGSQNTAAILTTPESCDLQAMLKEMTENNMQACIMEVSSSAIELYRPYGIDYNGFCFNNILNEHMDVHGDLETYFGVKAGLVRSLPASCQVVLNADDSKVSSLHGRIQANTNLFSAAPDKTDRENSAAAYADNIEFSQGEPSFDLFIEDLSPMRIHLSVPGYHSVLNAISAAYICYKMGISPEYIKMGLEGFKGVERRFECIYRGEFRIYDDYLGNEGSINATMDSVSQIGGKNLILLYAVRGSRGLQINQDRAELVSQKLKQMGISKILVTLSCDAVSEKDRVTKEERDVAISVFENNGIEVQEFKDLVPAVAAAIDLAQPGDIVLFGGTQGLDSAARIALKMLGEREGDPQKYTKNFNRVCGLDNLY